MALSSPQLPRVSTGRRSADPVWEGARGFAVTAKNAFNRLRVMVVKKSADLLRN